MACLYIDRLKSNFQQSHHFDQRANNRETWCPRFSINRLRSYKSELYCTSERPSSVSVAVKFNPVVPKIFTIGLHSNSQKMSNDRLSIFTVKDLLKRYLNNVIRRYRSCSHTSTKLVPNETCGQHLCSFHSLICIVSKCSKEFARNIWAIRKKREHCKCDKISDNSIISKNIEETNHPDKRYADDCRDSYKEATTILKNCDESEFGSSLTTERVIDYTVSSARSNASGDAYLERYDSIISRTKKDISVQTSKRSKLDRTNHRKRKSKNNRKQNISMDTPSSKDIETIFKSNSKNFNRKESNLSLDLSRSPYAKETLPNEKSKHVKSSKPKENFLSNSSKSKQRENRTGKVLSEVQYTRCEKNRNFTREKLTKRDRSASTRTRNALTSEFHNDTNRSEAGNFDRMRFEENGIPSKGEKESSFPSTVHAVFERSTLHGITTASRTPRNYRTEDKTSEMIILGNIKKRLEKEYDDYYSLEALNVEKDADDSRNLSEVVLQIDRTISNRTVDCYELENRPESKRANYDSTARNKNCGKSIEANLTYSFSIHWTNSDLSHSHSSYHTPLREHEDSQCSSIEYCSASNESSSNVSRANQNFNLLANPRTLALNGLTYNCALKTLPVSVCSPDDVPVKSNPIFQASEECSDEAMTNFDAILIGRRHSNSTPNLSNSSKLMTESLDSGVLSDCSHDHFLSSKEPAQKIKSIAPIQLEGFARELNLLETRDYNTDSSCSDDSLNRRVDVAVQKFTEDLALSERKTRLKLQRLENPSTYRHRRRQRSRRRQVKETSMYAVEYDSPCNSLCNFGSCYWLYDDDRITSCSTPPFFSFSDSEIEQIDQIDHT